MFHGFGKQKYVKFCKYRIDDYMYRKLPVIHTALHKFSLSTCSLLTHNCVLVRNLDINIILKIAINCFG